MSLFLYPAYPDHSVNNFPRVLIINQIELRKMPLKRTLYLGTSPSHYLESQNFEGHLIHYPVIKIVPRSSNHPELQEALRDLHAYTHLIFTSKNTVAVLISQIGASVLQSKCIIALGKVTTAALLSHNVPVAAVASEETQEGVIETLKALDLNDAYLFVPRSALTDFLKEKGIRHRICDLYDTVTNHGEPLPRPSEYDEIVFTSPSTVQAFKEIFGSLPRDKKLIAIGPITAAALET
jgi:uroporphyrinogen-III synthase